MAGKKEWGKVKKDVSALRHPDKDGYRCPVCFRMVKTLSEFWQHIERH